MQRVKIWRSTVLEGNLNEKYFYNAGSVQSGGYPIYSFYANFLPGNIRLYSDITVLILAQFFQATNVGSSFLTSLEFFLEKISLDEVSAAEQCFSSGSKGNMFSPQEREEYSYRKCTIIVRVMVFVSMILETRHQDFWKVGLDSGA